MVIFMTGGTGNIGQYVTLELLKRGHRIKLLSRTPDRIKAFSQMENVELIGGTILDKDIIKNALQGCDAVVHIALGWGNEPYSMLQNDTAATAFLLEEAQKAGVEKFLYTSSTAAAGNLINGMDETGLRVPTDLYGSTKASSEMFILGFKQYYAVQGGYGEKVSMKRNIIRPGYTYSNPAVENGYSQSDRRFANIADAIVNDKDLSFSQNDGTQFLSSRQIAKIYAAVLESDCNEEVFYALGKNFISWYEIALMAKDMYPQSKSVITPTDEKGEEYRYCVDKIEKYFGLSFDSGEDIKEHIRWNLDEALKRKN